MNLVFLLAACPNSLLDSSTYKYIMFMITNLIEIGYNYPEFHNELLDSYFFKLTLGSDCLELCFRTVAFKNILTQ